MNKKTTRRSFLNTAMASSLALTAAPVISSAKPKAKSFSANDRIRIGTIGMGIIGFFDTECALKISGNEFVAAADCYDGRLERTKEKFGKDIYTTREYKELLSRDDIDAVLLCVPDHWHQQLAIEAMKAGKAVYCEKPMVREISEGAAIIKTQKETGAILEVGSQFASSLLTLKAKELYEKGVIGKLNMANILISRNTSIGAWQYSIPPDASTDTIDWDRFQGNAPKRAFDADRFFRWRKYWDYGTGVAGDMYVHYFTALHRIISSNGPNKAMATGGVRFWTEKREAPDMILGLYEYAETAKHPAFTLQMGANFADGGHGPVFQLIGDEGMLSMTERGVTVTHTRSTEPSLNQLVEGYNSVFTFSQDQQDAFVKQFKKMNPDYDKLQNVAPPDDIDFRAPRGYDDRLDHMKVFFGEMRGTDKVVEDPEFGLRAAAPAILANMCFKDDKIYKWNPDTMQLG